MLTNFLNESNMYLFQIKTKCIYSKLGKMTDVLHMKIPSEIVLPSEIRNG